MVRPQVLLAVRNWYDRTEIWYGHAIQAAAYQQKGGTVRARTGRTKSRSTALAVHRLRCSTTNSIYLHNIQMHIRTLLHPWYVDTNSNGETSHSNTVNANLLLNVNINAPFKMKPHTFMQ